MERKFDRLFRPHKKHKSYDSHANAVPITLESYRSQAHYQRPLTSASASAGGGAIPGLEAFPNDDPGGYPDALNPASHYYAIPSLYGQPTVASGRRRGQSLKLGGDERYMTQPSHMRFSEDVADRNLQSNVTGVFPNPVPDAIPNSRAVLVSTGQRYSEDIADRNLVLPDSGATQLARTKSGIVHKEISGRRLYHSLTIPERVSSLQTGVTPPLKTSKASTSISGVVDSTLPIREGAGGERISRFPNKDYRHSDPPGRPTTRNTPALQDRTRSKSASAFIRQVPATRRSANASIESRRYLDLTGDTPVPVNPTMVHLSGQRSRESSDRTEQSLAPSTHSGSAATTSVDPREIDPARSRALGKAGINLTNTEDVATEVRYAKPVVHEVVKPIVHEIRNEVTTREIHTHDVFHRVLPIVDVEVLPAKHFVRDPESGELVEIPDSILPGGARHLKQNWKIVSASPESENAPVQPTGRHFTARTFAPDEGNTRVWLGEDGVPRSERTWVHPPTLEDGGRRTGQTQPFYFGDPESNATSTSDLRDGAKGRIGNRSRMSEEREEHLIERKPIIDRKPVPISKEEHDEEDSGLVGATRKLEI